MSSWASRTAGESSNGVKPSCFRLPAQASLAPSSLTFDLRENSIRLGAPVGAAGEVLRPFRTEQTLVGEISHPGLPLGGALRGPRRQTGFAHGLSDLAHLLGTAAAVLDHALEEISALLLPVDAGERL